MKEMKTTPERLTNAYTIIESDEHWAALGRPPQDAKPVCWHPRFGVISCGDVSDMERLDSEKFFDLINDRIALWRLEEDGFSAHDLNTKQLVAVTEKGKRIHVTLPPECDTIKVDVWSGDKAISADGINTYTDLITLIRLIG